MRKFGIGQAVRRVEDQRFLVGAGSFVDDISLPRQCYGVVLHSPHAHAIIKAIDVSRAIVAPGVVCVLTGADAVIDGLGSIQPDFMPEAWGGPKGFATGRPILLVDRVRCVGDRVAFVVAETEMQARDAAELIDLQYETLPGVIDMEDAVASGASAIWPECPGGNVGVTVSFGDKVKTDAAFEVAKHTVKLRLRNNRVTACSVEPRAALGHYEAAADYHTLYTTSQDPHGVRNRLAGSIFQLPESKFRVISPDVGGGFGMKVAISPEDALVLWASKRCGRPVKWTATRSESLLCDTHARDQIIYGELALDENCTLLGIRARAYQALGAYWWGPVTAPIFFSLRLIPSVYSVPAVDLTTSAVFTNTAPTSVYRGSGRPEAIYFIERMLDHAANVIGIDRVELRRRNLIKPDAFPYRTPTNFNYDSGEFERLMDSCLELADWDGFAARRKNSMKVGKLRGRSITPYVEIAGVFNDRMELRFDPSGSLTILAGTHSHGQGHATAFTQLVAEWLGIPFGSIHYIQGDTHSIGIGRGTFGARSSMVAGNALRAAADVIIEKAKPVAAALLQASSAEIVFANGTFFVSGTDRKITLTDVAKTFYDQVGPLPSDTVGLDGVGTYAGSPIGIPNFPNGCQVCEVEIDPETGKLVIDRFFAVDDLGLIINPLICEGQIHGGIAQGLGQAIVENIAYDESGQLITGTFMDYGLPRASDIPNIESAFEEIPAKTNRLGIKAIAESGTIAAPPTIVNAALDALHRLGVVHLDMPLTSMRIWQAIQEIRNRQAHKPL